MPSGPITVTGYRMHDPAEPSLLIPCMAMGSKGDYTKTHGCCPNGTSSFYLWQNTAGDGVMKADEFVSVPLPVPGSATFVSGLDPEGGIWFTVTTAQDGPAHPSDPQHAAEYLYGWRSTGVSAKGCPVYNPTGAPTYAVALWPEPFASARINDPNHTNYTQYFTDGGMSYISSLDAIVLTGYTNTRPFKVFNPGYW
jgi:hypothetical protein